MDCLEQGIKLYNNGMYAHALEVLQRNDKESTDTVDLAYYRGLCHARLGESDQAIPLFQQVLGAQPDTARHFQMSMLLVWIQIEKDNITDAMTILDELLEEGFKSPQTWCSLAYCHWKLGNVEQARDFYENALTLDKTNTNAANGLGYILTETDTQLDRAVELCQMAVAQDPENTAYQDSLGWALFKSGETKEAIRILAQALGNSTTDKEVRRHLEEIRLHEH